MVKSACNAWVGKIPWKRKWQPTPVFLPGKSHGWRSLAGYSPWSYKESNTTNTFTFTLFRDFWNTSLVFTLQITGGGL